MAVIDINQAVKRLEEVGIPNQQAAVIVSVMVSIFAESQSDLTTKGDLAEAKVDLLKWIIGAIGFQTLVIVGTVIVLARTIGS